ncbi:MAG: hypothetical protein R2856_24525 [Caldilineaceae bacterium]
MNTPKSKSVSSALQAQGQRFVQMLQGHLLGLRSALCASNAAWVNATPTSSNWNLRGDMPAHLRG